MAASGETSPIPSLTPQGGDGGGLRGWEGSQIFVRYVRLMPSSRL